MVLNIETITPEALAELAAEYAWRNDAEAMARGADARERGFYPLDDLVSREAWKAGGGRRRNTQDNDGLRRFLAGRAVAVPVAAEGEGRERLRSVPPAFTP